MPSQLGNTLLEERQTRQVLLAPKWRLCYPALVCFYHLIPVYLAFGQICLALYPPLYFFSTPLLTLSSSTPLLTLSLSTTPLLNPFFQQQVRSDLLLPSVCK